MQTRKTFLALSLTLLAALPTSAQSTGQAGLDVSLSALGGVSYRGRAGTWPNGENVGNHAKSFIIDDAVFYIGSQNLYVADLAEFGLFIDDEELTDELIADYWAPMWAASRSAAVSGADTGSCTF